MIKRETIPRHLNLFEFCKKHNLPLIIERGEHAFKKPYTRMFIEGRTAYDYYSRIKYQDILFEAESLQEVINKTVDYLVGKKICFNEKVVLRVPPLSYSAEGHEAFGILRGTKAVALFDWVEKENLTLVISTCESVKGKLLVRAEFEKYGIVGSHCYDGEVLTLAVEDTEEQALKKLIEKISEEYIAPQYYKNGWSCVDETKKIKVPALF